MKFSVLISVYIKENPSFLKEAMNSIFNQTLFPNEVILVKDGILTTELDNVITTFLLEYPSTIKVIALEKNIGLGEALNIGLKECSYNLVARMDSDDICKNDRFEKQICFLENNPDVDILGSSIIEFEDNNYKKIKKCPEYHKDILKYAKYRSPINHASVIFKKDKVLKAGGYKHFEKLEDYYLWVRMLIENSTFHSIQEPLMYARVNEEMYKRRGGFSYFKSFFKLQRKFLEINFINTPIFLFNIISRFFTILMPNFLRIFMYNNFLR